MVVWLGKATKTQDRIFDILAGMQNNILGATILECYRYTKLLIWEAGVWMQLAQDWVSNLVLDVSGFEPSEGLVEPPK
jgi:hypothetical protein